MRTQVVSHEVVIQDLFGAPLTDAVLKRGIPRLAKSTSACAVLGRLAQQQPSVHRLVQGDARQLGFLADESVHLVLTSPPYWTLKEYVSSAGQLGDISDYTDFVAELGRVWKQCLRVLVPGGRLVIVVGDVCLSRREHGRHAVMPLHASIVESCREVGFDNLAPIIWHKIANARFEADAAGGLLGKPYEPNAVIKNDIEFILMQRKPGGYRRPSLEARAMSLVPEKDHKEWFQQVWHLTGASTKDHPAPYPTALAERLVRMFSFVGDTVVDPFVGSGTTLLAAARWGRNSVGVEIEPSYVRYARKRVQMELDQLTSHAKLSTD